MNALETLISNARPMIGSDGKTFTGSWIAEKNLKSLDAHALTVIAQTSENFMYRDTGKHTHWNFTIGQRSYGIQIEISRAARKQVRLVINSFDPCDYLTASDLWDGAL